MISMQFWQDIRGGDVVTVEIYRDGSLREERITLLEDKGENSSFLDSKNLFMGKGRRLFKTNFVFLPCLRSFNSKFNDKTVTC